MNTFAGLITSTILYIIILSSIHLQYIMNETRTDSFQSKKLACNELYFNPLLKTKVGCHMCKRKFKNANKNVRRNPLEF